MAVIINELEVVVEQPAPAGAAGGGGGAPASGAAAPPLRPLDGERIRERQARLRLRVAAH